MNTHTILPSLKFSTPLTAPTSAPQLRSRKQRNRFVALTAVSFVIALPVLAVLDPQVLWSSGVSDAHAASALIDRIEAGLRSMAVTELFASGGIAVMALVAAGFACRRKS